MPEDVTDTYTFPSAVPSCWIVTVASVADAATVAVPNVEVTVPSLYIFTTSPAASPVIFTVSDFPVTLFVTVILSASGAVLVASSVYATSVLVLSSLPALVTVTYTFPASVPNWVMLTKASVFPVATVAVPNAVVAVPSLYTFTISPAASPVTATVSAFPALFVTVTTSAFTASVTASASYAFSTLALSFLPEDVTDTYTFPSATPSCWIVAIASVAVAATVAVPNVAVTVSSLYIFTTSPAASPVTFTVSDFPVTLFVTVILSATGSVLVASAMYAFSTLSLSKLLILVTDTYTTPESVPI